MNVERRHAIRLLRGIAILAACAAVLQGRASAHEGHDGQVHETLSFDRPEAWALKYFTSATLLGGLEPPRARSPWSVEFGAELAWLPPVSEAKRFVGFDGTKPEDLNKAPFFVRPRVTIGLPGLLSLTVAVDPPIRSFGLTPRLLALALERPIARSGAWNVGLRAYAQTGTVKGAYTCPSNVLGFAPGSPQNLYGCQAESSDTATLRYAGGEVSVEHRGMGRRKISPHVAIGLNYLDVAFQVNALTFGFNDRTHYVARGFTFSAGGGLSYPVTRRIGASFDAFYTPLAVRRPTTGREIDGFLNVRALLTYRLR